ncbi:transcription elongation regulator 1-like protein isoform X1 [Scleropages formosus]|uniref:transcription elongation regulator 1-like protein isoform X1 n=1 Tax=Scleropages formosus TaxID=113540 RepID=UPI0010FA678D|nr:transcription elongation regulator 1-like protein isoform X1 [Scleropages formosus]
MLPIPRLKGQPQLWHMSGEPPGWVWMIPATSGLCRIGAAPAPFLLSSHPPPPPLLQAVSSWQLSCEPFLPLMRVPSAEPAIQPYPLMNIQWELPSRPAVMGFQPSASMDLVPVFPCMYHSVLPPHVGKGWVEKRLPDHKVYLNNALALDSAWISPEETGMLQRLEKPLLMTNQMAMSISRPAAASRNLPTVLVSPQRISACPVAIKRVGSNKRIALAAAAMMAMESETAQGPLGASAQPFHLLSLSPIKIPFLSTRGSARTPWEGLAGPVVPIAKVTSLSAPAVTVMAGDLTEQMAADKSLDRRKTSCTGTVVLHADPSPENKNEEEPLKITIEEESAPKDKRPVASTPVPGSPWCVVWTGDDRVFFFNPTMQLSVWEKPLDLKGRGDLNRIIEDPPHKRKKGSLSPEEGLNSLSADEDDAEGHNGKTKRNKMEDSLSSDQEKNKNEEKCTKTARHLTILPLELRIAHFRDMLLERGVSAFSTWEKELHKIVFDPRYLLLSSDERKQIFDQFVKARIKEEYKEKKSKLQQAKEEFRKLLEESKITSRSTFKEFSEKHGRDQRFKLVQKRKDQEHFFNQFVNALKKRDKENRLRLRKMR